MILTKEGVDRAVSKDGEDGDLELKGFERIRDTTISRERKDDDERDVDKDVCKDKETGDDTNDDESNDKAGRTIVSFVHHVVAINVLIADVLVVDVSRIITVWRFPLDRFSSLISLFLVFFTVPVIKGLTDIKIGDIGGTIIKSDGKETNIIPDI